MIFIVTKSDQYYPSSGCGDWVLVTPSHEKARECFESLPIGDNPLAYATLIEIQDDGSFTTIASMDVD